MIPLHLHISGFLSYREPVDIDLTGLDLACISGANGAGKSSLLDAITWALFGIARKRDDSLINTQSSAAEVRLVFAYEGNIYRLLRSKVKEKTTVLEFHILQQDGAAHDPARSDFDLAHLEQGRWKPLTEHTLRETEKHIEDTLRLDYETFVNASFFLQGKADQFTQQRPSERKRILGSILGLDIWEDYRTQAASRRQAVEKEIQRLDGSLQEILAELSEEAQRTRRLQELQAQLEQLSNLRQGQEQLLLNMRQVEAALQEQQRMLEALGRQAQTAEQRCQELRTRLGSRRDERQTYNDLLQRAAEIRLQHTAWKDAQAALAQMEALASSFRKQEKLRETPRMEILSERTRLEQERHGLAQTQAQLQGALPEIQRLDEQLKHLEDDRLFAEGRLARREQLAPKLEALRQQQAGLVAENAQVRNEMNPLKERIDKILKIEGAECPLCGSRLTPGERQRLADSLTAQGTALADKFRQNSELIKDLEEQISEIKDQLDGLLWVENELRVLLQEESRAESRLQTLRSAQQAWETGGALRLAQLERCLAQEDYALPARARLAEIDDELRRTGYDPAAHDALRQQVELGKVIESELLALEKAHSALFPLEREIGELSQQLQSEETALEQQRGEFERAQADLAQKRSGAPDLYKAERELNLLREQENRLRSEEGAATQRVKVLADVRARRKLLEAEREALALQTRQYKQLERAFGKDGVPALLIEQALPEIEAKANELLDRLSDGMMSVSFVTQAQYKDKKRDDLRETLDIQIRDGSGMRDYEMFSGGEAFRVNFAVRLALSEILARRAGARLQTLVIDEGFGSQDTLGRQRLVEAIRLVRGDFAKILVITHIDELKDVFPSRIEVEKTERGSTARVV